MKNRKGRKWLAGTGEAHVSWIVEYWKGEDDLHSAVDSTFLNIGNGVDCVRFWDFKGKSVKALYKELGKYIEALEACEK